MAWIFRATLLRFLIALAVLSGSVALAAGIVQATSKSTTIGEQRP